MTKLLQSSILIVTFIGFLFGGYFFIDNRYAQATDFNQLERRVFRTELQDSLDRTFNTYAILLDSREQYPDNKALAREVEILDGRIKELKHRIKVLDSYNLK